MAKKRSRNKSIREQPRTKQWRTELKRSVAVAGAFILLSLLGQSGLQPIKAATDLFPQGAPFSLDSILAAVSFSLNAPTPSAPVTIIDIDETLYRDWGRPCITPRSKIIELIEAAARNKPKAIVLDVGLGCSASGDECCAAFGTEALSSYLANYRHEAQLLLIRELHAEERAGRQEVRIANTPFDAAVSANSGRISWAHTFYVTDGDGTVRRWQQSWEACGDSGNTETVPSVPLRIQALMRAAPAQPSLQNTCDLDNQLARQHLIVIGDRVLGPKARTLDQQGSRVVPARLLLDTASRIDADGYFSLKNRIAIIGASHSASDDSWRTVLGYMPGVELVAHTIQTSAHQLAGSDSFWRSTLEVLVTFVVLATIFFFLRPFVAAIVATLAVLGIALLCSSLHWFDIFESLERTIWYFAGYQLVLGLLKFTKDAQRYQRRRKLRALLADRIRREDPECQLGK